MSYRETVNGRLILIGFVTKIVNKGQKNVGEDLLRRHER